MATDCKLPEPCDCPIWSDYEEAMSTIRKLEAESRALKIRADIREEALARYKTDYARAVADAAVARVCR